MAGYVVSMRTDNEHELIDSISKGVYGTVLNVSKGKWTAPVEGTIADYLSMKKGDHIYFFSKRKLYGIGKLVAIGTHDCKLLNYEGAGDPSMAGAVNEESMIIKDSSIRFICTFEPDPMIFKTGLDMDFVLQSNPAAFKMLRAFWKLSFIKIDDVEDQALFDIIHRENFRVNSDENAVTFNKQIHKLIESVNVKSHELNYLKISASSISGERFQREMGLEAAMISYLMEDSIEFGNWDYLSHQVVASPIKPVDYMDKMDIFGYRKIPNYETIDKYLVMELKKDRIGRDVIDQTMKYVDWVNQEYAHGDFEMIEAYVVASEFEEEILDYCKAIAVRSYSKNKPAINKVWRNLRLFKYRVNADFRIEFDEVTH